MTLVYITSSKSLDPSNPSASSAWDGWSRRMESQTFKEQKTAKYGNKKYNCVKLDAVERKSIDFNGKTYKFDVKDGPNGRHELSRFLTGDNITFPMVVILDKNKEILKAIPGYLGTKDFKAILEYFGNQTYKKQTWEAFVKEKEIRGQN